MNAQPAPQPAEHRPQWREDALPEEVGANLSGGGSEPVRRGQDSVETPGRRSATSPLVLLAALAALATPALWVLGYWAGGAPGVGVWRAAALVLAGACTVAMYWLARRSA